MSVERHCTHGHHHYSVLFLASDHTICRVGSRLLVSASMIVRSARSRGSTNSDTPAAARGRCTPKACLKKEAIPCPDRDSFPYPRTAGTSPSDTEAKSIPSLRVCMDTQLLVPGTSTPASCRFPLHLKPVVFPSTSLSVAEPDGLPLNNANFVTEPTPVPLPCSDYRSAGARAAQGNHRRRAARGITCPRRPAENRYRLSLANSARWSAKRWRSSQPTAASSSARVIAPRGLPKQLRRTAL